MPVCTEATPEAEIEAVPRVMNNSCRHTFQEVVTNGTMCLEVVPGPMAKGKVTKVIVCSGPNMTHNISFNSGDLLSYLAL